MWLAKVHLESQEQHITMPLSKPINTTQKNTDKLSFYLCGD
jgi:hypothetical protein